MKKVALFVAVALAAGLLLPGSAHAWLMNKDVSQTFTLPQDNFEVCFAGNFTGIPTDRGIIAPSGWRVQKSFNAQTNTTCFSFYGPPIKQQAAGARPIHFGLGLGQGLSAVKEKSEYWTRRVAASATPGGSTGFIYNPGTRTVTVTVSNDTDAATVLQQVGWRTFSTAQSLAAMDRDDMPPASFKDSGIAAGTVLKPGDQLTYTIEGVSASDALVFLQTVGFAEPTEGGYNGTVTIWTQEQASVGADVDATGSR